MIMYTLGQLFSNKLLQAAGICQLIASVADVQEIDILLRSDVKDIISQGHYQLTYCTNKPVRGLFISEPFN